MHVLSASNPISGIRSECSHLFIGLRPFLFHGSSRSKPSADVDFTIEIGENALRRLSIKDEFQIRTENSKLSKTLEPFIKGLWLKENA